MPAPRSGRGGDVHFANTVPGGTTSVFAATGPGAIVGWSVAELSGTTATFRIHDGNFTGATNAVTALVKLAANQYYAEAYPAPGIALASGPFIERIAGGSTEFTVYF